MCVSCHDGSLQEGRVLPQHGLLHDGDRAGFDDAADDLQGHVPWCHVRIPGDAVRLHALNLHGASCSPCVKCFLGGRGLGAGCFHGVQALRPGAFACHAVCFWKEDDGLQEELLGTVYERRCACLQQRDLVGALLRCLDGGAERAEP